MRMNICEMDYEKIQTIAGCDGVWRCKIFVQTQGLCPYAKTKLPEESSYATLNAVAMGDTYIQKISRLSPQPIQTS